MLATFGQLTDTHVRDEESPARVPFLDRLGAPLNSTFRPHEAFSTQVLDAAVRALGRERPQAVVVTGDIVDSAQENELDQALAVLRGDVVAPDSGRPGYDGVQAASNPDPFYFRPDNDAPRHPGALAAAQGRFRASGLRVPWYPAVGNHDVLVQGEVPATEEIEAVATGDRMVTGIDPAFLPPTVDEDDAPEAVRVLLAQGEAFGRAETVPADPARRHLTPAELVDAPGGGRRRAAGRAGPARLHVRPRAVGPRDRPRHREPRRRLARRRDRAAGDVAEGRSSRPAAGSSCSPTTRSRPPTAGRRRSPRSTPRRAWPPSSSGNRHRNTIEPRDGYWLIGTSSLADFPQQARMFRLREARGGAVLETWMVDHDGRGLAGTARELAYLDAQGGRPQGFAGRPTDRNARLFVQP